MRFVNSERYELVMKSDELRQLRSELFSVLDSVTTITLTRNHAILSPRLGPLSNARLLGNLRELGDGTHAQILGLCDHHDSYGCPDIQVQRGSPESRVADTLER
jgi:hypothetical protein